MSDNLGNGNLRDPSPRSCTGAGAAPCYVLLLLALMLGGCGAGNSSKRTEVVYGVVGSACNANITYHDLTRSQTALTGQALPWHFEFEVPQAQVDGFPLFLSAQNNCAVGSITANVEVNGALFASQTTFAPNGLVQIAVSLF